MAAQVRFLSEFRQAPQDGAGALLVGAGVSMVAG
jgi:hypothetical protein